jgi:hypothetical protein
MKKYILN